MHTGMSTRAVLGTGVAAVWFAATLALTAPLPGATTSGDPASGAPLSGTVVTAPLETLRDAVRSLAPPW